MVGPSSLFVLVFRICYLY